MSTLVECIFADPEPDKDTTVYRVVAFCQEHRVSEYKFDRGHAIVLATTKNYPSNNENEIVAESITIVQADFVPTVRKCLHAERQLALPMASGGSLKQTTRTSWPESPPVQAAKKCKAIQGYPNDPDTTIGNPASLGA